MDKVIYPKYGYCLQTQDYDPTKTNMITVKDNQSAEIFLTDEKLLTYNTFDITAHVGDHISLSKNMFASYLILLIKECDSADSFNLGV